MGEPVSTSNRNPQKVERTYGANNLFLVFDFDGTLADTFPIFRQAFDDAAHAMNVRLYRIEDEAHIRSLEAAEVLRFHGIEPPEFARFAQLLRAGMTQRREQARMVKNVPAMLDILVRNKFRLGLISSSSRALVESVLGVFFPAFEFKALDISLTEKAATLKEAASTCTSPESMCYFGDEIRDVKAAQAANVPFAAATWGFNSEASLRKAGCERILSQPRDILDIAQQARERNGNEPRSVALPPLKWMP